MLFLLRVFVFAQTTWFLATLQWSFSSLRLKSSMFINRKNPGKITNRISRFMVKPLLLIFQRWVLPFCLCPSQLVLLSGNRRRRFSMAREEDNPAERETHSVVPWMRTPIDVSHVENCALETLPCLNPR